MRYELNDYEWCVIRPMLPNKPHGVPRVDDRRDLLGPDHEWSGDYSRRGCDGAVERATFLNTLSKASCDSLTFTSRGTSVENLGAGEYSSEENESPRS